MAGTHDKDSGGRDRLGNTRKRVTERDIRLAIYRLQDSAYANLRSALANGTLFVGFFAGYALAIGEATGALTLPAVVCVLAGVCGAGYYLARVRPAMAWSLLLTAIALAVIGVTWFVIASAALDG